MYGSDVDRSTFTSGLQLATRCAVAATLAFAMAQVLKLDYPVFALIAAVIGTDLTPAQSRELGLRRLIATVVGAVLGAAGTSLGFVGVWAVGPSILIAMIICQLVGASEGAKVAGYICALIVLLDESTQPWHYAFFRMVETALGVSVAWSISYVPKLLRPDDDG